MNRARKKDWEYGKEAAKDCVTRTSARLLSSKKARY